MERPRDLGVERRGTTAERKADNGQEAVAQIGPDGMHPRVRDAHRRMAMRTNTGGERAKAATAVGSVPFPATVQPMLEGLLHQAGLLDVDGTILAVNRNWRMDIEVRAGMAVGVNYRSLLTEVIDSGFDRFQPFLTGLELVRSGERSNFKQVYTSDLPPHRSWEYSFSRIEIDKRPYVLMTLQDVRELVLLKRQRRQLQRRVLHAQEDERRHLARELHDSTGQLVASLQIGLMRLKSGDRSVPSELILDELSKTVDEIQRDLRALAFMCHPPELLQHGLATALTELVEGFGNRTGLEADFSTDLDGPCSSAVEATIYRVAQEALSNVYRHSQGTRVSVRLLGRTRALHLVVRDDGIGFDAKQSKRRTRFGVGTSGMRERLRELGGHLAIRPTHAGTVLIASLPREQDVSHAGSDA